MESPPFNGSTIYKKSYLAYLSAPSEGLVKHDRHKNVALWVGDSSYR